MLLYKVGAWGSLTFHELFQVFNLFLQYQCSMFLIISYYHCCTEILDVSSSLSNITLVPLKNNYTDWKEKKNLTEWGVEASFWSTRPARSHACSDHYYRTCCLSVPTFQNLVKHNNYQMRIVIATGLTVGLAEWIIDGIHCSLYFTDSFYASTFPIGALLTEC